MKKIYLDNAATTPLRQEVISEMMNDKIKADSAWTESMDINNYLISNYFPLLSDYEKEQFFNSISKISTNKPLVSTSGSNPNKA